MTAASPAGTTATEREPAAKSRRPLAEADLAARFSGKGPWKKRLPQILATLVALGRARAGDDGSFGAA